jgi:hypothetical protein
LHSSFSEAIKEHKSWGGRRGDRETSAVSRGRKTLRSHPYCQDTRVCRRRGSSGCNVVFICRQQEIVETNTERHVHLPA